MDEKRDEITAEQMAELLRWIAENDGPTVEVRPLPTDDDGFDRFAVIPLDTRQPFA